MPKLRPIQTYIGANLELVEASGVPIPVDRQSGKVMENNIKGRFCRVSVMKKTAKRY
jgi:hypothetical protein